LTAHDRDTHRGRRPQVRGQRWSYSQINGELRAQGALPREPLRAGRRCVPQGEARVRHPGRRACRGHAGAGGRGMLPRGRDQRHHHAGRQELFQGARVRQGLRLLLQGLPREGGRRLREGGHRPLPERDQHVRRADPHPHLRRVPGHEPVPRRPHRDVRVLHGGGHPPQARARGHP